MLEGYQCNCNEGKGLGEPVTLSILAVKGLFTAIPLLIGFFGGRKKPGQKVATTQIVNEAEGILQQNVQGWEQSDKTPETQAQALNNFQQVWQGVVTQCGDPVMGSPGQNCISERDRGGVWDWWSRYYDPIALDPGVQVAPSFTEQASGVLEQFGTGNNKNLFLFGGLALGAVALLSMGGKK
jgi:hypothetical protein